MFRLLFLIFLVIPIVEIYVLLTVGGVIGAIPTIALVVLTAVVGAAMIRVQGMMVVYRLQEKLQAGEMPAEEILTGVALLVAGAFLLTPGFVTDTAGFLLLMPAFRRGLMRYVLSSGFLQQGVKVYRHDPQGHVTIEGDYRDDDGSEPPKQG